MGFDGGNGLVPHGHGAAPNLAGAHGGKLPLPRCDIFLDLVTGWIQKAGLTEMVVSETNRARRRQPAFHGVIERTIRVRNVLSSRSRVAAEVLGNEKLAGFLGAVCPAAARPGLPHPDPRGSRGRILMQSRLPLLCANFAEESGIWAEKLRAGIRRRHGHGGPALSYRSLRITPGSRS